MGGHRDLRAGRDADADIPALHRTADGPEEIYHIVDDQETIVIALRGVYINRWILLVVTLQIQQLLLVQLTGVDGGSDTRRALT